MNLSGRLALALLMAVTSAADALDSAGFGPPILLAQIIDREIGEISGMAASSIAADRYWLVNDSNNPPLLFAINRRGQTLTRAAVIGHDNRDWEAMAAFQLKGRPYLMIADVGDNHARYTDISLLFMQEPAQLPVDEAVVEWVVRVVLPTGPADIESVFVEPEERSIYLLSKRETPPQLWRVPLQPEDATPIAAELLGTLATIPPPSPFDFREDPHTGGYRAQPTDMALHPDRHLLAVLTYGNAYAWRRAEGESWAKTLTRQPARIDLPRLVQPEALTFTQNGQWLLLSSEKWPAPLIKLKTPIR